MKPQSSTKWPQNSVQRKDNRAELAIVHFTAITSQNKSQLHEPMKTADAVGSEESQASQQVVGPSFGHQPI